MGGKILAATTRLVALCSLGTALTFAETWSGALVDSKCYGSEERNVNPRDTLSNVDRDRNMELHYCAPTTKTKSFAVIQEDWTRLNLDPAGNAKAADLVRNVGKQAPFGVVVTGDLNKRTIKVDSITKSK